MKKRGRILGVVAGGVLVGSVVGPIYGLYSGNEFFFPKALRLICLGVRMVSNTRISFDEAYGSIKEGRIKVRDIKIKSSGNTTKDFDLQINSLELVYGAKLLTFLRELEHRKKEEIHIEKLYIKGITGKIDIIGDSSPLPDFCVKEMSLENIQLEVTDHTKKIEKSGPFTFPPIALYRFYGKDLHTNNITKDIFMKSSLLASFGAGVAGLENRKTGAYFVAKNIPLGIISKYLMEPFSWFTQALLDADITDVVLGPNHDLAVNVKLHKLVPDSTHASATGKLAVPVLASYINPDIHQISLSFPITLKENELTMKNISRQIAIHLMQQTVKEGSSRIGKSWDELKQRINESVQNLSQ